MAVNAEKESKTNKNGKLWREGMPCLRAKRMAKSSAVYMEVEGGGELIREWTNFQ